MMCCLLLGDGVLRVQAGLELQVPLLPAKCQVGSQAQRKRNISNMEEQSLPGSVSLACHGVTHL